MSKLHLVGSIYWVSGVYSMSGVHSLSEVYSIDKIYSVDGIQLMVKYTHLVWSILTQWSTFNRVHLVEYT